MRSVTQYLSEAKKFQDFKFEEGETENIVKKSKMKENIPGRNPGGTQETPNLISKSNMKENIPGRNPGGTQETPNLIKKSNL
jgi:hypothetical protein